MTKKEAIKLIQGIEEDGRNVTTEHVEALGLAIKALMAYRDCRHCTHNIKIGNMRGCELWDCDFEDMRAAARPQGELAEKLKDRIEENVCKYCQMNKRCELCEISRVFSIIALTDKEMKEGADNEKTDM